MSLSKSLRKRLEGHFSSAGMSKVEIQSWIAASGDLDEDEELNSFQWDSINEDSNWPSFLDYARGQLLTSSTKLRIEFLTARLTPLAARGGAQRVESQRQCVDNLLNE